MGCFTSKVGTEDEFFDIEYLIKKKFPVANNITKKIQQYEVEQSMNETLSVEDEKKTKKKTQSLIDVSNFNFYFSYYLFLLISRNRNK